MKKIEKTLLIEDNEADVDLLRIAYQENKIETEIIVKYDGEEALEYLNYAKESNPQLLPQLILLDLNLPKKSGKEILKFIKADHALRSIPIIIMSTSSVKEDVSLAYNLNANAYLTKLGDFKEFLSLVKSLKDFWYEQAVLPPLMIEKAKGNF